MRAPDQITVAIADDHAIFRQGLKSLLKLQRGVVVVGEAARVDEIAPLLASTPCDIVLLDFMMDRSVLGDIAALAARTKVIILTASEHPEEGLAAIREGASAVVFKRFAVETLMDAVRSVLDGEIWMPPALQAYVAGGLRTAPHESLTPREREVIVLVALGLRNSEVAQKLFISEETVKTHLNNIFRKLNLRDRVELTLYAARIGVVRLDQRLADAECSKPPSKE